MDWYIVKMVFQIIRAGRPSVNEFDIQLRLILADEREWAVEKATIIGRLEENSLNSDEGSKVSWKFIGITEIGLVGKLEDSSIVYSDSEEPSNLEAYKEVLRSKILRVSDKLQNIPIGA